MQCWIRTALAGLLVAACGSEAPQSSAAQGDKPRKDASGIDACALVTAEEMEGAAGWNPRRRIRRPISAPRPALITVRMALRSKRSSLSCRPLEASAKGLLLAVRASSLEVSKTLAAKAIAQLP
jgi:hypothetical protein